MDRTNSQHDARPAEYSLTLDLEVFEAFSLSLPETLLEFLKPKPR